jgi:hypothetical protein
MSESRTRINVIKTPYDAKFRPVKVEGSLENVKRGIRKVIELVEHILSKNKDFHYRKRPEIDMKTVVKAKILVPDEGLDEIVGLKGEFAQGLYQYYQVEVQVYKNKKIRSVDDNESILVAFSFTPRRSLVA